MYINLPLSSTALAHPSPFTSPNHSSIHVFRPCPLPPLQPDFIYPLSKLFPPPFYSFPLSSSNSSVFPSFAPTLSLSASPTPFYSSSSIFFLILLFPPVPILSFSRLLLSSASFFPPVPHLFPFPSVFFFISLVTFSIFAAAPMIQAFFVRGICMRP